jgi:hypothetical protein
LPANRGRLERAVVVPRKISSIPFNKMMLKINKQRLSIMRLFDERGM